MFHVIVLPGEHIGSSLDDIDSMAKSKEILFFDMILSI